MRVADMTWLRVMASRFIALFRKDRLDQEMNEEIHTHLEMLVEENTRKGMPPDEAHNAARRSFGGLDQHRESYRDQRSLPWVETLFQDIRFAARVLLKNPGFTVIATSTLALGIGATTSIFSVVDAVLLRPLPYKDQGRLVAVWESNTKDKDPRYSVAPANFVDFRAQSKSFVQMAAYMSFPIEQIVAGLEQADKVRTAYVSPQLFEVLGTTAVVGRVFLPEEDQPVHAGVVLLSHEFWQRRFGGIRDLQGLTITLDDSPRTVVGVLPPQFRFPSKEIDVWLPLTFAGTVFPQNQITARSVHYLGAVARLKANVSLKEARTELECIAQRLERAYPDSNTGIGVTVNSLLEETVGKVRLGLLVLMAGVGFVLLIACANVANLMLARSLSREREVAVRAAVGASRLRIIRQFLTESGLVAVLSGGLGLLTAHWGIGLLVTLGPANIPRLDEVALNVKVLAFAVVLSALTGMLFGMAPARQLSRVESCAILRCGGRDSEAASGHPRFRRALVILEMALSMVLLVGAGLMIRSFAGLMNVDPGFNSTDLLTMEIMLPPNRYTEARQRAYFYQQLYEDLKNLPKVKYVGGVTRLPLSPMSRTSNPTSTLTIEGQIVPEGQRPSVDFRRATRDYFRAMEIPLLAGREFTERDSPDTAPVAMINDGAARMYFSGMQPVGRRIRLGPNPRSSWITVVGVVGSIRHLGLDSAPRPEVYVHALQEPPVAPFIVIRTSGNPAGLLPLVRSEVRKLDRGVPIFNIATMEELIAESLGDRRFSMLLMGTFAVIALALAALGIYGVITCSVSQRTREIGIRMAMGAQRRDVLKLVLREVAEVSLAGLGVGMVVTFGLTRLISTLLYGVRPTDPWTFAGVSALLFIVVLAAAYVPTRRAMKVDPIVALRDE
jgi:putative ABC transport system permease protein